MNKLSKQKRDQLIMIVVGTVVVLGGLWFGLIDFQKKKLATLLRNNTDRREKVGKAQTLVKRANEQKADLAEKNAQLKVTEDSMASGDMYLGLITLVNNFLQRHAKVNLIGISRETVSTTTLLPNFPYKSATFIVECNAFYHDFGTFLADFENKYPYMRIQNMEIFPLPPPEEKERLKFRFEIICLVKPAATP
jgi:hypothetical protein